MALEGMLELLLLQKFSVSEDLQIVTVVYFILR
jgi:hypothetical protein